MVLAIASDRGEVSAHLGHCSEFVFFEINDGVVGAKSVEPNGSHDVGLLPGPLRSRHVDCVVAGGMGGRAQQNLRSAGIDFYLGVSGAVDEVARQVAAGTLEAGESSCNH
jgi:predicted Fe-Mo cluster-binding NifX family protein